MRLPWVFGLCAFVASCGPGNSNFTRIAAGASAPPIAAQGSFTVAQVNAAASPAPGVPYPIALPSAATSDGAFGGQALFPMPATVPANLLFTEILSNAGLIAGLPALQNARRAAQGQRGSLATSIAPLLYIEIVTDPALTFAGAPSFSLSVPASEIVANTTYYLAQYDLQRPALGWQLGFEGPATISGTTLTFAAPSPASPLTMAAEIPLYFALYGASGTPAPTPAPSVTPIAAMLPFTFSPASLTLAAGANGNVAIVDPSGYTGSYAATSTAAGVTTASATGTALNVTGVNAGDAWIVVSAASGASQARTLPLNVQVNGTPGGSSGSIDIGVPTPSPVLCSPSPVSVPVGQSAVIDCTAAGYVGSFTAGVADPTIASVQLAAGTTTFFYVDGLQTGTTIFSLQYPSGGAGADTITVTP